MIATLLLMGGCAWISDARLEARLDQDGDGYEAAQWEGGDCDDENAEANPEAAEVYYDGVDEDCDPTNEYDRDGDGWDAEAWGGADCDDSDPEVNPGATEVPLDHVDNDCDGVAL